jgi:signal transduction histidine kinase
MTTPPDARQGAPRSSPQPTGEQSARPETYQRYETPPVSGASQRLRALATLSGSLTDALNPHEAADLVERQALSALGATSAVVVTLGPFPPASAPSIGEYGPPSASALHVVHAIGLPLEVKAALEQLPIHAPVPLAEVAREGLPLFLPSEEAMRHYPDWAEGMIQAGAKSAAVVPVWANGELRGVLGLTWNAPRTFDEDECAFVLTLGTMCAQAIMRSHLKAAELDARTSAEHANLSKGNFVTTISHELRTPINALLGYTQVLSEEIDGPITARQKHHLGRMQASGAHLLVLIDELLGFARIEAGQELVRPAAVILGSIVEESLAMVRPLAETKGLRIRYAEPAEPLELFTDATKLRQILVNVLANAVKYTVHGDVVLLLRVADRDTAITIYFEVTDTGRGIAPEDQEHIFDAFWQRDPTAKNSAGSSGLGLSVARRLARLLGGDVIVARSALGAGSTFVVSLPAQYEVPRLLSEPHV